MLFDGRERTVKYSGRRILQVHWTRLVIDFVGAIGFAAEGANPVSFLASMAFEK